MTSKEADEIVNVKFNQENAPSAPFEETQVRVKRFSKDVPTFSGKMNESFDNWSWDIRQCIRIEQMNDREAALAITTKLKGAPHNLYRDYIENCVSLNKTESYAEFHQQLEKIYGNSQRVDDWLERINKIRRNHFNTMAEYVDEFTELSTRLNHIKHQRDLIIIFRAGLDSKVAQEIELRDPTTLDQTIRLAITLDRTLNSSSSNIHYVSREINKNNYNKYANKGQNSSFQINKISWLKA